jgi:hypothetical protein
MPRCVHLRDLQCIIFQCKCRSGHGSIMATV